MLKLTNEQKLYLEFSILCGYRVLPIFENKYPEDARPRNALEAAWAFFAAPSEETKAAFHAAHHVAADAAAVFHADADAAAAAYAAAAHVAAYAAHDAATDAAAHAYVAAAYAAAAHDAAYVAVYVAERRFQFLLLSALNTKYKLSIKIEGVE